MRGALCAIFPAVIPCLEWLLGPGLPLRLSTKFRSLRTSEALSPLPILPLRPSLLSPKTLLPPSGPAPNEAALARLTLGDGGISFAAAARLRAAHRRVSREALHEARQAVSAGRRALAGSVPAEAPALEVANAPALPLWVQDVHGSHTPLWVGGAAVCTLCAGFSTARFQTSKLFSPCCRLVSAGSGSAGRLARLRRGMRPSTLAEWPDGLAEPSDPRTVWHHLRVADRWSPIASDAALVANRTCEVFRSARFSAAGRAVRAPLVLRGLARAPPLLSWPRRPWWWRRRSTP